MWIVSIYMIFIIVASALTVFQKSMDIISQRYIREVATSESNEQIQGVWSTSEAEHKNSGVHLSST